MAHILCVSSGLRGILYSSVELLNRLQRAGHTTVYACGQSVSTYVEDQGIRYCQLPPVNFSPAPEQPRLTGFAGSVRTHLAEWRSASQRRTIGVEQLDMGAFRELLKTEKPDLVLIDVECYEHQFAAWAQGSNVALITPFFANHPRPGLPPLQTDIIPGHGFKGSRVGMRLAWLKIRLSKTWQRFVVSLRYAFTERRAVLLDYARQQGYPIKLLSQSTWVTLFNDRFLPTLSLNASELDFAHLVRPDYTYVGPLIAEHRVQRSSDESTLEALEKIYTQSKAQGATLLYCGLTTMSLDDDAWVEKLVNAVGTRSDWWLILTGVDQRLTQLIPDVSNVFEFAAAPQLDILDHVDLCITHGGVNTLNECVLKGVPMVMYPHKFADNPGCMARAVHHGIALQGWRNDSQSTMVKTIQTALGTHSLGEKLRQLRDQIKHYDEQNILAYTITQLIEQPTRKT